MPKPRLVGINHVALEVGDVEAAIEFYGRIFEFELRGRVAGMAFLDLGDQFLALSEPRSAPEDADRHFGLVVDDKEAARTALVSAGVAVPPDGRLDFRDPWGNLVEIVGYRDVQFIKDAAVLRGMALGELRKGEDALRELAEKGLSPS